jgi:hypothetical protein
LNIRNHAAKIAAVGVLPLALAAIAPAQQVPGLNPSTAMSFKASTDRETWHNVLIVSAIVLGVGLLGDNSTLTFLGGAGVILSLVETNGNTFRYRSMPSLEMMHFGQASLGFSPFDQIKLQQGVMSAKPSLILQTTIKF